MKIEYPIFISEFDTQAELCSRLKGLGYDVRGEVRLTDISQQKGYREFRFDLVVFKEKEAKIIIEVKRNSKKEGFNYNTRQFKKYSLFNIPLIYCFGIEDIEDTIKKIASLNKN